MSHHSRIRLWLRNSCLHIRRKALPDRALRSRSRCSHRLSQARKSEPVSLNRAWLCAAASRFSAGRSRGSWTDMAAVMIMTSRRQPLSAPAITIRPKRGSMGRRASWRPIGVSHLPRALAARVDGVELLEQGDAVADVAQLRRVDERERLDVAQPERRHLQDHRREVGADDLGFGELGPVVEVLLGVETDADAGGDPTAPTRRAGWRSPARRPRSAAAGPWCGCCSG